MSQITNGKRAYERVTCILMTASAPPTMEEIASDAVMEQAYAWLCARRKDYAANTDVWDVRWRWATLKPQLQAALRAGTYRLGVVERIHLLPPFAKGGLGGISA